MENLEPYLIECGTILQDRNKKPLKFALVKNRNQKHVYDAYTENQWEKALFTTWYVTYDQENKQYYLANKLLNNRKSIFNPIIYGDAYKLWNKWETTRPIEDEGREDFCIL